MVSFNDIRQKFISSLSHRPPAVDMSLMQSLCGELIADIPHPQRVALTARLATMLRASDLWNPRTALFDVISHHHGETVAQQRLHELDRELRPSARPKMRS